MKKLTFPMLIFASALCALQAHADERQIDWSTVPGNHGRNDVSRDFIATPDPLNVILSNSFSAWEPNQKLIAQARTSTGRTQRHAVLGNENQAVAVNNVSYTTETIVTTQSAPSNNQDNRQANNEPLYSEGGSASQTTAQNQAQAPAQATQLQNQQEQQNNRSSGTSDQSMAMNKSAQTDKSQSEAQAKLAPHTLMIETSLASAMDHVRGIKGELGVTKDMKKADQTAVKAYKSLVRDMKNELNVARVHERQLTNEIRNYPDLAKSDEYRSVNPALQDLQKSLNTWESKASSPKYWQNQEQARADVDNIEKQLNDALSKVKSFSSGKLNASLG
jgi:hypothetical protein